MVPLGKITFSITTFSITTFSINLMLRDTQHNGSVFMLSANYAEYLMLTVPNEPIMLNVVMLGVIMLCVVMLCVVILGVLAPQKLYTTLCLSMTEWQNKLDSLHLAIFYDLCQDLKFE